MHTSVVIVVREGRALCLLRGSTAPWYPLHWNLPGGVADEGETPEQTAMRECLEEAGLRPTLLRLLRTVALPQGWGDLHVFLAEAEGDVVTDYESADHAWLTAGEVASRKFVPYVTDSILEVLVGVR